MIKMKVNYDRKATGIYVYKLTVGSTFFSKRSGVDEVGLYMVVDRNSGIFLDSYKIKFEKPLDKLNFWCYNKDIKK